MNGICHFCQKNTNLELSHIVPNFVYKWFKESSGTGYIRSCEKPNQRIQDGIKRYLLCSECEDLFNQWETKFANNLFYPFIKEEKYRIEYRSWLLKFVISLSWRVLLFFQSKGLPHLSDTLKKEADLASERWKGFLLGKESHPGKYQQHLLPLGIISSHSIPNLPQNIHRYLLRSIDIDVVSNETQAFVYVKLPYFLLIGFIRINHPDRWENTMLHVHKGIFGGQKYIVPKGLLDFLTLRANKSREVMKVLSEKQKQKIEESFKNDPDKLVNSDCFKALNRDVELFGKDAFIDQ